jgi:hypothetical protein
MFVPANVIVNGEQVLIDPLHVASRSEAELRVRLSEEHAKSFIYF